MTRDDSAGRGRFIALEGPEGAGKSTQLSRLAASLEGRGWRCVATREPGGTAAAEAIRGVLLDTKAHLDGVAELLLFSAARRMHVEEVIRPALERGETVLCDRFELATRVYQGVARGVPPDAIERVTRAAVGDVRPDLYVILDVPVEVGLERQRAGGAAPDRIEREARAFRERVRAGYRKFAREARDGSVILVNGVGTTEEVGRRVEEAVLGWLDRRGGDGGARGGGALDGGGEGRAVRH